MKVERVIIVSPCQRCGYKKVCSNYCAICGRRNDYVLEKNATDKVNFSKS